MFTINSLINYFISRNVIPLKSNLRVTYNHKHLTKHFTILVPAPLSLYLVPYFHKFFCSGIYKFRKCNFVGAIWDKFVLYMVQVWHTNSKNGGMVQPLMVLFGTNLMSNINIKAP